jgi:hypothetical protein
MWNFSFFVIQIVHNYFGRTKHFVAPAITGLQNLDHSMIGLRWVVAHGDRFVAMRVEGPADRFLRFNAMAFQELMQLLQRHPDAIAQLFRGRITGEGALEVIDDRQKLADESFLLRRGAPIGLARGPFAEVIEIGREPEIQVLLLGQICFARSSHTRSCVSAFRHVRVRAHRAYLLAEGSVQTDQLRR